MRRTLIALSTIVVLAQPPLSAQPAPLGSEFQVNTYTTNSQQQPAVAMDRAGRFVVVWEELYRDGSLMGIFGQRYDSSGMPVGATDFQVNSYTTSVQGNPVIGMEADGDFVVVWFGIGPGDYAGIFARRYSSSGNPRSAEEFRVNTYTDGLQFRPEIAVYSDGRFVIVWQGASDTDSSGISARTFGKLGAPLGPQFQINALTAGPQERPSVASDGSDGIVVAWMDSYIDGYDKGIVARRFDTSGTPLDAQEFQVNSFTTAAQRTPDIAVSPAGEFIVTWNSDDQDGDGGSIVARRFDRHGIPKGQDFVVNALTTGDQVLPTVDVDKSGGFVISWASYTGAADLEIYGRRFDASGLAVDPQEFLVNSYSTTYQAYPAVAMNPQGRFIVAWDSRRGQDGHMSGVFAQRFDCDDTDGDGLCDPLDILITSPASGGDVNCETPGMAQTRPLFVWQKGNYDRFRAVVSWTSNFAKGTRVSSGPTLLTRNRWKPGRKAWKKACDNGAAGLYVRIFGVDNQRGNKHPHKKTLSDVVDVFPIY